MLMISSQNLKPFLIRRFNINRINKLFSVMIVCLVLLYVFGGFKFSLINITKANEKDYGSVDVRGKVNFEPVVKVYPEKRIPTSNNWGNITVIDIRYPGTTTPIFTQVLESDTDGTAQMKPIDISMVPPGNYDIGVKGYSHLREVFPDFLFFSHEFNIDLTISGKMLLAGDTTSDNMINSLDLSYMIKNLYSGASIKNDLNRDGIVNSLDISNLATNLYLKGKE